MEAERYGQGGGGTHGPAHHHTPASSGSIADNLPASALASLVSNASGNPNAGAAVVAEAQSQEYQQYWQQYQQQAWSQYAAWNQYSQQMAGGTGGQPPMPPTSDEAAGASGDAEGGTSSSTGTNFDGDEMELIG
jgi:hypothetical protein